MEQKTKSLIEVNIAVLLFGLAGLFGKLIQLPAVVITFGRVFFAAIALLIFLLLTKQSFKLQSKKDYLYLAFLGIILSVHWFAFFQSIQMSTVAIGLLTFSSFPIFVTFLEPYVFKEKLKFINIILAIIVFLGIALILPSYEISNNLTQGVLWGVLSGFTFALLSVLNKKYVKTYSSMVITFYEVATASVVLLPFLILEKPVFDSTNLTFLIVLGVIFTALSHSLFVRGMRYVKAHLASIIATLEPVYGVIFAFLLLGEVPELRTIVGGLVILGTAFYASRKSN
ncbi:MAG: DMT family transporter [Candidatus Micrarchaeota archaeon]|nr:DMT family transporter [Candidatus Micrarchaeota archaeon]